jgi:elongation factor Ts
MIKVKEKKQEKVPKQGVIDSYIHSNKRVGVLLELNCQTDFVARTSEFQNLSHEICLQIAAMNPENTSELIEQPWIKDPSLKIKDLIEETTKKLGEKISIRNFTRYEL